MRAFKLVNAEEWDEFTDALKKHGWHEEDFRVQEEAYDPATAEVESETGQLIITCSRTHSVGVYTISAADPPG